MTIIREDIQQDGIPIIQLESDDLIVDVAPEIGGRVIRLRNKTLGYDFLWRNAGLRLERLPSGSEYDPNFYGGIDELIPNDIPECIDTVNCPDHGELWTTPLSITVENEALILMGTLPLFGLHYERRMSLRKDGPWVDFSYRITNPTRHTRHFLWKLHAALAIQAGDEIDCPAQTGQVVDLAWSRFHSLAPFPWPTIEGRQANLIPAKNHTVDFFYLFNLWEGRIAWRRPEAGWEFAYHFDLQVFPFSWLFASFGGFLDHYTVILEPCTTMPISVNEAIEKGRCSLLQPGDTLTTKVSIYAGPIRKR